ncbi:MAG: glycyl-radical enzyme activating protein [Thermoguttaceae bacterium]|nr:glycyl-radical enzyme activating protein [Thermoguttaceae bacterium]
MNQGVVFEIREFSLFDGPGIRTTVYLKGCPLHCVWCHNPEGISPLPEILFAAKSCIHCGTCRTVCERKEGEPCRACGHCAEYCPTRSRRLCGRFMTVDSLVTELLRMRDIFRSAEGSGVTFSGGEPLMQIDFVVAVANRLHVEGIHTAVETSGYASRANYQKLVRAIDFIYQDIKHPDDIVHRRFTGVSNRSILENLELLKASKKPFVIRIPLIPTVNDTPETLAVVADKLTNTKNLQSVELLPYHGLSGGKYSLLGRQPSMIFPEKTFDAEVLEPFKDRNIPVRLL